MQTIGQVCAKLQDQTSLPARVEVLAPWTDNCPFKAGQVLRLDPALGVWIPETGNQEIYVLPFIIRRCFGVFFKAV